MDDNVSKALELKSSVYDSSLADNATARNPVTVNRFTKGALYSFIGFLAVTALFAIITVLSGSFSEFELKVLATTSIIALASICALCCSAFSARSKTLLPGFGGILVASLGATMVIAGIWLEIDSQNYWKTTAILSVFAIACAHTFAILRVRLKPEHQWIQIATAITILALAVVISGMIVDAADGRDMFKFVTILAILAALETLVIPILGRLNKIQPELLYQTLVLTKKQDGKYHDKSGRVYEVHLVSNRQVDDTNQLVAPITSNASQKENHGI